MFNSREPFKVRILSGTEKICEVNYPSDRQWCELARKKKSIKRQTGRGLSEWEDAPGQESLDKELLDGLRPPEASPEFDKYEASKIVGRLARASLISIERSLDLFRIELRVFGGEVVHTLKMPTEQDKAEHERLSSKLASGKRHMEYRIDLEPSGAIWDRLKSEISGYAEESAVPIVHKAAALAELIAYVQELEAEDPE